MAEMIDGGMPRYRTCCCTGYLTNPGGRCCQDVQQPQGEWVWVPYNPQPVPFVPVYPRPVFPYPYQPVRVYGTFTSDRTAGG
jgi:hypothetical protein